MFQSAPRSNGEANAARLMALVGTDEVSIRASLQRRGERDAGSHFSAAFAFQSAPRSNGEANS